ncbi:MAG: hypothetical protein ACEQSR_10110 [Candidatus Methylacidiphilales bacterium]
MNYRCALANGKEEKVCFETLSKEDGNKMQAEITKSRNEWNRSF